MFYLVEVGRGETYERTNERLHTVVVERMESKEKEKDAENRARNELNQRSPPIRPRLSLSLSIDPSSLLRLPPSLPHSDGAVPILL